MKQILLLAVLFLYLSSSAQQTGIHIKTDLSKNTPVIFELQNIFSPSSLINLSPDLKYYSEETKKKILKRFSGSKLPSFSDCFVFKPIMMDNGQQWIVKKINGKL